MREIHVDRIVEAVRAVCLEANYVAGADVRAALTVAERREVSPLGRQVLGQLLEDIAIAEQDRVPMCQSLKKPSAGIGEVSSCPAAPT